MKIKQLITIILLLILVVGCSRVKYIKSTGSEDKKAMKTFLSEIKDVALNKHYTELMTYMDSDYLHEQHDYFLKGNDLKFVNEIFCGNDINDNSFHCIEQQSISYFGVKEVTQIENTKYKALFIVGDDKNKVACKLLISKKIVDKKVILGIVGAIG
jgi:hypothetical protein